MYGLPPFWSNAHACASIQYQVYSKTACCTRLLPTCAGSALTWTVSIDLSSLCSLLIEVLLIIKTALL